MLTVYLKGAYILGYVPLGTLDVESAWSTVRTISGYLECRLTKILSISHYQRYQQPNTW